MKKLSVVLAVYNEELNLTDCLKSVEGLADEIVIVDGGSIDKTVEIAKKFKAKVIQTDNPPIFHINKNKAIDRATGDWILQLDADERVTDELAKEIKRAINNEKGINGYWLPRKNFFLGRFLEKGGQYPDYTMRLYKRGRGRLPAKDVHEQAVVEGQVSILKNNLLHLRDLTFSKYIEGLDRYTNIMAAQLAESRLKIGALSFIDHILFKPLAWFLKTYIRHKGFQDGFPGFVFSYFSSLRFPISYMKYWSKVKV